MRVHAWRLKSEEQALTPERLTPEGLTQIIGLSLSTAR